MTLPPAPRAGLLPLLPLLLFLGVPSGLSAQTAEWVFHKTTDGLHPDGREQQLMWLMNREYIELLFTETLGKIMLVAAFVMMTIGMTWMRKVMQINV